MSKFIKCKLDLQLIGSSHPSPIYNFKQKYNFRIMMGISGRFFVDKLMELRKILGFENNFSILLGNNIMYEDLTYTVDLDKSQI